jgi:hypothetical protein
MDTDAGGWGADIPSILISIFLAGWKPGKKMEPPPRLQAGGRRRTRGRDIPAGPVALRRTACPAFACWSKLELLLERRNSPLRRLAFLQV